MNKDKEIEELQNQVEKLQRELKGARQSTKYGIRHKMEEPLRSELADLTAQYEKLFTSNVDLETRYERIKTELGLSLEKIIKLQTEKTTVEQTIQQIRDETNMARIGINNLTQNNNELQSQIDGLKKQLLSKADVERDNDNLNSKLKDLNNEVKNLKDDLQASEGAHAATKTELLSANNTINEYKRLLRKQKKEA